MNRIIYWGLAILILLLGIGVCVLFIRHNRAELADLRREASEAEHLLRSSDRSLRQSPRPASVSSARSNPPPGETHDTGHWEGNVWHKSASPESKQHWWTRELDINAYIDKMCGLSNAEQLLFAKSVIEKQPYSEAALDARYRFAGRGPAEHLASLKAMLKYHPQSPRLLADIASRTSAHESPAEAVAYAKKALESLRTSSERHTHLLRSPLEESHRVLGTAYQRLGNNKAALVHLKAEQRLLRQKIASGEEDTSITMEINGKNLSLDAWSYASCQEQIAAIEAGEPLYPPYKKAQTLDVMPVHPAATPELSPVDDTQTAAPVDPTIPLAPTSKEEHATVSPQAPPDFMQHRREHADFMKWMDTIENAKSPDELDNFLMREIAVTLAGGKPQFEPERIIRAFETLQRHGETQGMRQLQKIDKDIATAVSRHKRRVSPRTPPMRPKTQ